MNDVFHVNMQKAGGWKAALYRKDGSVDLDMPTHTYNDTDKVKIAEAKLLYIRKIHADDAVKFRQQMEKFKGQLRHLVRHDESEDLDDETANVLTKMGLPLEPFQKVTKKNCIEVKNAEMFTNEDLADIESTIVHVTRSLSNLCGMYADGEPNGYTWLESGKDDSQQVQPNIPSTATLPALPRLTDSLSEFHDTDPTETAVSSSVQFGSRSQSLLNMQEPTANASVGRDSMSLMKYGHGHASPKLLKSPVPGSSPKSATKRPMTAPSKSTKARRLMQRLDLVSEVSEERVAAKEQLLREMIPPHQRMKNLKPFNMRPRTAMTSTGNKSFVDNNTHDGWRKVQHQQRVSHAADMMREHKYEFKYVHGTADNVHVDTSKRPFGLARVGVGVGNLLNTAPPSEMMMALQALKQQRPTGGRVQSLKDRLVDAVRLVEQRVLFGKLLSKAVQHTSLRPDAHVPAFLPIPGIQEHVGHVSISMQSAGLLGTINGNQSIEDADYTDIHQSAATAGSHLIPYKAQSEEKRFDIENNMIDPDNPYMTNEQKRALFISSDEVQNYARDLNLKINKHLNAVTGLQTELSALAGRYDYHTEIKQKASQFYDNPLVRN
jgi:hypothetical protein